MVGMANLPNELLLCICMAAQTKTLLSMERTCRTWLLEIRKSDMELWKNRMLSRFPRMRLLLPILESRQTLIYRVLYRNQLEAECFESTASDAKMEDYVVTVELLCGDEVRETSCGRFRSTQNDLAFALPYEREYFILDIGRLWDTQPQWFSQWDAAEYWNGENPSLYPRPDYFSRPRIRVFVTLGNRTLKLYEGSQVERPESHTEHVEFGWSGLTPFSRGYDDYTMDVLLRTNYGDSYAEPFTNADGTVHYSADDILEDTGTVTLFIRAVGSYFDVDCMRRYLATMPWPKRARGGLLYVKPFAQMQHNCPAI